MNAYHQQITRCTCCRGQQGKQVTEQLLVEHVRDLAAYDAKTLVDMFGDSTGTLMLLSCICGLCILMSTCILQLCVQV